VFIFITGRRSVSLDVEMIGCNDLIIRTGFRIDHKYTLMVTNWVCFVVRDVVI